MPPRKLLPLKTDKEEKGRHASTGGLLKEFKDTLPSNVDDTKLTSSNNSHSESHDIGVLLGAIKSNQ